mgnify:CR=1 FL=1
MSTGPDHTSPAPALLGTPTRPVGGTAKKNHRARSHGPRPTPFWDSNSPRPPCPFQGLWRETAIRILNRAAFSSRNHLTSPNHPASSPRPGPISGHTAGIPPPKRPSDAPRRGREHRSQSRSLRLRVHISGAGGSTNSQSVGGPRSSGSGSTPTAQEGIGSGRCTSRGGPRGRAGVRITRVANG